MDWIEVFFLLFLYHSCGAIFNVLYYCYNPIDQNKELSNKLDHLIQLFEQNAVVRSKENGILGKIKGLVEESSSKLSLLTCLIGQDEIEEEEDLDCSESTFSVDSESFKEPITINLNHSNTIKFLSKVKESILVDTNHRNTNFLSDETWTMVLCYLPKESILTARLINRNSKLLVHKSEELGLYFATDGRYRIIPQFWNLYKKHNFRQECLENYLEIFSIPSVNFIKSQSKILKHKADKFCISHQHEDSLGDFEIFEMLAYSDSAEHENQILELLKHVPFCAEIFAGSSLKKVADFANSHIQFSIALKYKHFEFRTLDDFEEVYNIFAIVDNGIGSLYMQIYGEARKIWIKFENDLIKKYPYHALKASISNIHLFIDANLLSNVPRNVVLDSMLRLLSNDFEKICERKDHEEIFQEYQEMANKRSHELTVEKRNEDFEFFVKRDFVKAEKEFEQERVSDDLDSIEEEGEEEYIDHVQQTTD